MNLQLTSSDKDRARIVFVVTLTLSAALLVSLLAVIVLTAFKRDVPELLGTVLTGLVTGMLGMLVKISNETGQPQPDDPVPVTVADEPVQVQEVPGEPTWSTNATFAPPQDARPSPFPNH